jgi:lipopolysaccharide exporter
MLNDYLNQLRQRPFLKNFFMLSSGSILAQLIVFAVLPVITRLYSKQDFGIYTIYTSVIMVIAILATLKYELAVVLPEKDTEAINVLALCLIITLILSLILFGFSFIFDEMVDKIWPDTSLGNMVYLIPLSIFFIGIFQAFNYWLNRKQEYKKLAAAKICKSSVMVTTQSAFGFLKLLAPGLILGLIAGQMISAYYIVYRSINQLKYLFKEISLNKMWQLAKRYKKVPLLNTTTNFVNMLSNQLPVFFLGVYYGPEIAGFYGLANRAINTPTGLVSLSFGQVFYQRAAEVYMKQPEHLFPLVKKVYKTLFKTTVIPFILLAVFAPIVFELYFGKNWEMAGIFSRLLVPWLFLVFMNSPVSYIVTVLGKQQQMVIYDLSLLTMRAAALVAGYLIYQEAYYSVLFYALVGFLFNLFFLGYLLHIAKIKKQ